MNIWMLAAIFVGGLLLMAAALMVVSWASKLFPDSGQIAQGGPTRENERD